MSEHLDQKHAPPRRRPGWSAVLAAASAWLVAGCGGETLQMYCGAGIRPAADEAVAAFTARHGIEVACDYAGSEVLLSRLKISGRGDLFMPGEREYLQRAADEGLIASQHTVCYFVPVILVQKGNPRAIASLDDLTRPGIRLGLGDEKACAIGTVAAQILAKNRLDPARIDANVVFRSMTVSELGNNVKLKALDAAIVWDAVAKYFEADADAVPIPPERNVVSTVAVGVLKTSQRPEAARRLAEFLAGDEGREIFRKQGYTVDPPLAQN